MCVACFFCISVGWMAGCSAAGGFTTCSAGLRPSLVFGTQCESLGALKLTWQRNQAGGEQAQWSCLSVALPCPQMGQRCQRWAQTPVGQTWQAGAEQGALHRGANSSRRGFRKDEGMTAPWAGPGAGGGELCFPCRSVLTAVGAGNRQSREGSGLCRAGAGAVVPWQG